MGGASEPKQTCASEREAIVARSTFTALAHAVSNSRATGLSHDSLIFRGLVQVLIVSGSEKWERERKGPCATAPPEPEQLQQVADVITSASLQRGNDLRNAERRASRRTLRGSASGPASQTSRTVRVGWKRKDPHRRIRGLPCLLHSQPPTAVVQPRTRHARRGPAPSSWGTHRRTRSEGPTLATRPSSSGTPSCERWRPTRRRAAAFRGLRRTGSARARRGRIEDLPWAHMAAPLRRKE